MNIISFVWEAYSNLTYNLPIAIYSFLLRANLLLLCPIIAAFLAFRQGVRNQKIQTALIAVGILIAISLPLNRFMTPTMWRPWLVIFLVLGLWYLPKARSRLAEEELKEIFDHTVKQAGHLPENEPLNGRRVIVVDGTGVSMPDTKANQNIWPQSSTQNAGCGFPSARICACFSLETGHALSYEVGNKKSHELRLLRKQHSTFREGDIFLGDKGFCSYYDMAVLLEKGVDSLVTLARRTPVPEADSIRKLGNGDLLISWRKPVWSKRLAYTYEEWKKLPERLVLRQVKVNVTQPEFRVNSFYIVTTLLDETAYPAEELAELYFRRWEVELNFRDLKTTMGMDVLRCKSPAMIRKEIQMHFIVYNAIRNLIYEAAEECSGDPRRISFKGALQSLRHWEPQLNQAGLSRKERFRLTSCLYDTIHQNQIPDRPGRREPRCLKRRLKPYQLLTEYRHTMKETEHRSKYRTNAA